MPFRFYKKKLSRKMPATPGSPRNAETASVAALMPTAAPRLLPRKSKNAPKTAEIPHLHSIRRGLASARSASANRQTKIAFVQPDAL